MGQASVTTVLGWSHHSGVPQARGTIRLDEIRRQRVSIRPLAPRPRLQSAQLSRAQRGSRGPSRFLPAQCACPHPADLAHGFKERRVLPRLGLWPCARRLSCYRATVLPVHCDRRSYIHSRPPFSCIRPPRPSRRLLRFAPPSRCTPSPGVGAWREGRRGESDFGLTGPGMHQACPMRAAVLAQCQNVPAMTTLRLGKPPRVAHRRPRV